MITSNAGESLFHERVQWTMGEKREARDRAEVRRTSRYEALRVRRCRWPKLAMMTKPMSCVVVWVAMGRRGRVVTIPRCSRRVSLVCS